MRDRSSSNGKHRHEPKLVSLPGNGRSGLSSVVLLVFLGLFVVGATLFAHWPALSARAVSFDDEEAITQNYLVQQPSWGSVQRFFGEVLKSSVVPGYYRPLTLTSLMLDWGMGGRGNNFYPFHRTSLALHVGSTVLVMLLCYQLFGQPIVAAMVGLLFGVHPLTVEPVTWVMERKTILAAFFAFACLCSYVRYAYCGRRAWFLFAVVLYLLSLLAKPTGTPLPIMLLLLDYWPLQRLGRRAVLEKTPFLALASIFAVLAYACENLVNPLSFPAASSPLHLPLRMCWLVVFYLTKVVFPIHLSSAYQLPVPLSPTNPLVLLGVLGTALLIVGLILSRRWTPALWVGTAVFFLGLAPTMGFVGYSWVVASDKYVYLPAVGLVVIGGWLLQRMWSGMGCAHGRQIATVAVVLAATGLLTAGTRSYLREWQTTEQFVNYMLSLSPDSPELRIRKGLLESQQERQDEAIREFSRAIELQPSNVYAYFSRSLVYGKAGDYDRAIRDCSKAIELWPGFVEAFNSRGAAYGGKGDYERAIQDYNRAIELRPDFVNAYNNRSLAHRRKGEYDQAVQDCTKSISLMGNQPLVYRDRGNAYFLQQKFDQAIRDFTTAIELDPDDAIAFRNRGSAYAVKGDYQKAAADFTRAIALKSDYADAYQGRAAAYCALGDYDRAWADLKTYRQLGRIPSPDLVRKLTEATGRVE